MAFHSTIIIHDPLYYQHNVHSLIKDNNDICQSGDIAYMIHVIKDDSYMIPVIKDDSYMIPVIKDDT